MTIKIFDPSEWQSDTWELLACTGGAVAGFLVGRFVRRIQQHYTQIEVSEYGTDQGSEGSPETQTAGHQADQVAGVADSDTEDGSAVGVGGRAGGVAPG